MADSMKMGDGGGADSGCRMLGTGTLSGGPSTKAKVKTPFFSIDVTIFGVLKFHDI